MSSKKDSVTNIIKPLAAAFLTTEPEEETPAVVKPQPRRSAPKPVVKAAEVKIGELTKEETRALLREQLVSAGADDKPVKDAAEEDEVPFEEEKEPVKKAASVKEKESEKKAAPEKEKESEKKAAPVKEKESEKKAASVKEKESEKKAAPAKKETAKKEPVKKEAVKESAKKEAAPVKDKEPDAKKAPKAEVKAGPEEEINIEYGGCSYSKDDLVNRALKIWTSKLKRGRSELHNMELYVKPQENTVYYVFNGKRKGSFEL